VTDETPSDRLGTLRVAAWAALALFGALLVGGLVAGVVLFPPAGAPGDRTVLYLLLGGTAAGTVVLAAADVLLG
jgi:hypothetical protein